MKKIERLHAELAGLKEQLETSKQRGWFMAAMGRVFTWTSAPENRKALGAGGALVKSILLEAGDQTPQE